MYKKEESAFIFKKKYQEAVIGNDVKQMEGSRDITIFFK